MSALWSSLISAGAGLLGAVLGAVIGVIGALRASREASQQASQTAIEQVRYAVRYERRAQVMATAYDKVGIARDKLALLISIREDSDLSSLNQGTEAYLESSADAEAYLTRNAVWNDPEVDQELREVLKLCQQSWSRFYQVWTGGPSTVDIEESRKHLEHAIKDKDWAYSIHNRMERSGHMLQRRLDLEKPQRAQ